jgi:tetratricopeptide (TPR) repeat protein
MQRIKDYLAGKGTFTSRLAELEKNPRDIDLLYEVAERYCSRGKFRETIDHYERVIWWDQWNELGKSDQSIFEIGITYLRDKEYGNAVVQFDRLIESYPHSPLVPDAWVYKGYVYQKWGKKDTAIAIYQGFLDTFPSHEEVEWVTKQIANLKGEN